MLVELLYTGGDVVFVAEVVRFAMRVGSEEVVKNEVIVRMLVVVGTGAVVVDWGMLRQEQADEYAPREEQGDA